MAMKKFHPNPTENDLKIIVGREVTPPENLEFRGFRRRYTGPQYGPHPFINTPVGCAVCEEPSDVHTHELAAVIAIRGTTNGNDLKAFGEAIQAKMKEFGNEIAGIGMMDAETGEGADLE